MRKRQSLRLLVTVCLLLPAGALMLAATTAGALWSDDPLVNLAIADGAGEQVLPKIAVLPDGGCYVGWFDNASGNYNVRLQRLDAGGNELWGHNGILVSGHAQDSWISDWDLICDSEGYCVLTFSDNRTGNWDVQAYRIGPYGEFVWGVDGINLSQDADWEPSPSVCEASDGDLVFAWARYPDAGNSSMQMQRVTPEGTLRFAAGGVAAVFVPGESPGMPDLEPSLNGDVLLMWVRDISVYTSPRHIRLQRFTATGAPVWATFTAIFDAGSVPMGYAPRIQSDGAGGAVCGWHRASGNLFGVLVQRVDADGTQRFAHNGVAASTNATRNHLNPATAFHPSTGEVFVFWNEENADQTQWGVFGQRFSAAGDRLWIATGLVLQPVNAVYKSYPRAVPLGDGAVCLFTDTPAGFNGDRLVAYRLDAAGTNVWATVPLLVSTAPSGKSRLPLCIDGAGVTRIIWEDTRNGTPDIYGQNLTTAGYLGIPPAPTPDPVYAASAVSNCPNPFRSTTEILFGQGHSVTGDLLIFGPAGQVVRRLRQEEALAGRGCWLWDGRNDAGHTLPAGVYAYRLSGSSAAGASGKAVLVR